MKNNNLNTCVVGIGASAGGLNAIQELFNNLPDDTGMSFVIVQHLSPDFVSLMPELLSKHTKMEIFKAKDNLKIEPNCIYLNDRNNNIEIKNGHLLFLNKAPKNTLNLPIDIFFHSLGSEYKQNSIGIILSGTGSDGSRGIKSIKDGGGIVIVQDPISAQFDGMPKSAILTGNFDSIHEPSKIAEFLIDLSKKYKSNKFDNDLEFKENFSKILTLIQNYSKIDFNAYKVNTLHRRLEKRLILNKIDNLSNYYSHLKTNKQEKENIKNDFLIGVTEFFRDSDAFSRVNEVVIPTICSTKKESETIRIWIPGCSTGEEVYSIAILFQDYIRKNNLNLKYKIFATDINETSIDFAGKGVYSPKSVSGINEILLKNYFEKINEKYVIKKAIRDNILFSKHNLITDPPFIKIDLISCRNLLIYLESEAQNNIMNNFHYALNKLGFLFLGTSESLGDISSSFKVIDVKWKIFQNTIPSKSLPPMVSFENKMNSYQHFNILKTPSNRYASNKEFVFDNYLFNRFNPTIIFINRNFDILYTKGDAGRFLQHNDGVFQNNLLKIINSEITLVIRNGIQRVDKEEKDVVIKDVVFKNNTSELVSFDLIFHKILNFDDLNDVFLIEFNSNKEVNSEAIIVENVPVNEITKQQFYELESELNFTRSELQNVFEELETSNEELQSSNEELMASNEELLSTNEELQSVNEELYTVNTELQEKNKELQYLNNDMNNLLDSTDIGTLFLDNELKIRKFTPALKKHFKLEEDDYGRPIASFASNFSENVAKTILEDADYVLKKILTIEKEIQNKEGKYFLIQYNPFVTFDKKIDGVVISFIDITNLKEKEHKLIKRKIELKRTQEIARIGSWHLNIKTNEVYWTEELYKMYNLNPSIKAPSFLTQKRLFTSETWNLLTNTIENTIKTGEPYELELQTVKNDNTNGWIWVRGEVERNDEGVIIGLRGIAQDITNRKNIEEELIKARKIAESANVLKNNFLANMSHEIRTPMNSVVGFSDLLKNDDITNEERKKYLNIINTNSEQLLNLIDDIIDIAKIESNELKLSLHNCEISKIIYDLEFNFNQLCKLKDKEQIDFKAHIPEGYEDLIIYSDSSRIKQVFSNLLNNAFKFSEKGTILFGFEIENSNIKFFVKDQGIGIPKENRKEIFERFKQVNYNNNNARLGGTGLGLSISKGIIELLGGKLIVKSKLNFGSEFIFSFPLQEIEVKVEKKVVKKTKKSQNPLYGKTILIAEDSKIVQFFFKEILKYSDANVLYADNGEIAVKLYKKNPQIDIILMDIRMPILNGFEAMDEIFKINPEAKIIAQTAHAMTDEREKCFEKGCKDYFTKPIKKEVFFEIIEKWIN